MAALMRWDFAFVRSAIQDGCAGGGVGLGFSSVFVILDSSQLDLVGLHRLEGLEGEDRSGLSPDSESWSETIDLERECKEELERAATSLSSSVF